MPDTGKDDDDNDNGGGGGGGSYGSYGSGDDNDSNLIYSSVIICFLSNVLILIGSVS
jgi:hypothetical protein